jgi:hypothetical protein
MDVWWNGWLALTDDARDPRVSTFSMATPPAVLSRDPDHTDIFVMGIDGRVWTTWWAQGINNNRWNPWFPITDDPNDPERSRFSTTTPPAVLSRDAGHADVFVMGNDGRVWTTWWAQGVNNNHWNPWFPITDNPGDRSVSTFSKASPPAALARGSARMDLFLIGSDARVWTNWWGAGGVQYVPGSTLRVCQLTADDDPEGLPHVNRTLQWGCEGTDLGIPVDHDGRLYLFLGDVPSRNHADPIAYTFALEPDPSKLLLTPVLESASSQFRPYNMVGTAKGYLGLFETPTGGFSYDGQLWVFCVMGFHEAVSYLTVSRDPADDFDDVFTLSDFSREGDKFFLVAPHVIKNADVHGLPDAAESVEDGVLLWGQAGGGKAPDGTRNWGHVYLAWLPLTRGKRPRFEEIQYRCEDGSWCGEQRRAGSLFEVPEVTLLSVGWIPGLQRWVMLYTRAADDRPVDGIVCRVAEYPWDWSDEVTLFHARREAAYGRFMHWPGEDDLDVRDPSHHPGTGWPYAPGLIERFTKWNSDRRTATLVYTMSTNSPYQVQLMSSTIRISEH